jgi:LmbE family N-acetylglucosaminyl deacetylase
MKTLSPLNNPTTLPFQDITSLVKDATPALVVAPHPDDETLGCGGAIALLRQHHCRVHVLVMSDGTQSHPNSRLYPPSRLRDVREQETQSALDILGVEAELIKFMRFRDTAVPTSFQAISRCHDYLRTLHPGVIFIPWRNDPHCDHQATHQLIQAASALLDYSPRLIEYPIWEWEKQQDEALMAMKGWRLDISAVVDLKQRAVQQYLSQITDLIPDDPDGFRLTPKMLSYFAQPWEVYFEQLTKDT